MVCGLLQRTRRPPWRTARTFAGRAVFSPPHMSPKKMIETFFRRCGGETLRGFCCILCSAQRGFEKPPRKS